MVAYELLQNHRNGVIFVPDSFSGLSFVKNTVKINFAHNQQFNVC